jgi:Flp pilus assembly protein TadG
MAIDYSRGLAARQTIASAIDAAALAVGSSVNLSESEIEAHAQAYFDANKADGQSATISVNATDDLVTISATGAVDTTFLRLIHITKLDVGASTEVTKRQRNIELIMALDNTGSMSWSGKLTALKTAATQLVNTLYGEEETPDDLKIGLVPFAAAVNIGSGNLNSGWIDVNALSSIASEDFTPGTNPLTLYSDITNRSWNGCVRARPAPYDTSDAAATTATPDTLWVPYFAPDEPDFSWYANRYAPDDGYTGDHDDYDARQRYSAKYDGYSIPSWEDDGPDFNCWTPTVTPLTNVKTNVIAAIDAMTASGSTVIPGGLSWGWRLVSPDAPFTEGAAYDDEDTIKVIVLLTDGQNSVGGGLGTHNNSYYNSYGYAQSGHLGATSGSQSESTLDAKTATLCQNIKDQDIRIYTITFQLSDGPTQDLMRNCATSTSMYYNSPTNEELETVFDDIAKGLSELRISK